MAIIFKRARAMQQQQRQQMVGLLIDAGDNANADAVTPSSNTRSYTLRSVPIPSSPGR